jgi:hypothetical protein
LSFQRVALDRLRRVSYIAAGTVVLACRGRPEPLLPAGLTPAERDSAVAWAVATLPRRQTAVQFRWRYRDERVGYSGRGVARMAPPDSLRFDFRGPFGYSGAAAIIGDSVMWTQPPGQFGTLVRGIPVLWAALGAVQPPAVDAEVFGRQEPGRVVWRFVHGATDTLDYAVRDTAPQLLEAEWRQGGKVRARSRTEYGADGQPVTARIDFPEASARFEFTVVARDTLAAIAPGLWRAR